MAPPDPDLIDRLRDDHDRVRAILARLDQYLDDASPPVDIDFARLRWALMRETSTHHAIERAAFPRVTATLRGSALYEGLDRALDADLTGHMRHWIAARIHGEWARYRAEARLLSRRLRRRMSYEESALFPAMTA